MVRSNIEVCEYCQNEAIIDTDEFGLLCSEHLDAYLNGDID